MTVNYPMRATPLSYWTIQEYYRYNIPKNPAYNAQIWRNGNTNGT